MEFGYNHQIDGAQASNALNWLYTYRNGVERNQYTILREWRRSNGYLWNRLGNDQQSTWCWR